MKFTKGIEIFNSFSFEEALLINIDYLERRDKESIVTIAPGMQHHFFERICNLKCKICNFIFISILGTLSTQLNVF